MVQLRSLLRFAALLVAAFVLTTCAHYHGPDSGTMMPSGGSGFVGPCGTGAGSADRDAPIVCVDDSGSTLTVSPDPIRVNEKHSKTRAPVVLQWFTKSGRNDLEIRMEEGCVEPVKCDGKGHCMTKALGTNGTEKRCKYTIWTDKHPKLDPDVIITPCC